VRHGLKRHERCEEVLADHRLVEVAVPGPGPGTFKLSWLLRPSRAQASLRQHAPGWSQQGRQAAGGGGIWRSERGLQRGSAPAGGLFADSPARAAGSRCSDGHDGRGLHAGTWASVDGKCLALAGPGGSASRAVSLELCFRYHSGKVLVTPDISVRLGALRFSAGPFCSSRSDEGCVTLRLVMLLGGRGR
jgi:hypothetical protein